jgi:hypothetical protein
VTLNDVCLALRREYGSDANAARAHDLTKGQWNKLKNWGHVRPTQSTLDKLGIEEVRTYRWRNQS